MKTALQTSPHPYVGMWVTEDGYVRQELRSDGRYDEARGTQQSAYQGDYQISGNYVTYQDDTGFTADGYFENDVLYHGGMVMFRQDQTN
ncbi:Atu4866 domain-containing protein [Thalassospira lucentensis]|uniref:Atu4866 domain-containing protein n=1 Tax=Thalassospira lucentensis TaxID=168935 RepID=UPI003D2D85BF